MLHSTDSRILIILCVSDFWSDAPTISKKHKKHHIQIKKLVFPQCFKAAAAFFHEMHIYPSPALLFFNTFQSLGMPCNVPLLLGYAPQRPRIG